MSDELAKGLVSLIPDPFFVPKSDGQLIRDLFLWRLSRIEEDENRASYEIQLL